ncbi:tyrosine-type recombinase/integrase [Mameliella alba]|uniref:tyrosine-type recombinase/integrase n=1 Tax=Mameliella alba TaxID=561184 RepID=UPI0014310F10|nr:tyrosine-type recombinase/integrase [Mameliella alba]
MPTTSLSDRTLKSLPAPDSGQVTYWDSSLSGFGVRVSQGGAKSFVVVYGPNRTRKTIGRYPTISLKQAREKAKELKAAFTLGLDQQRSITWAEARQLFLEDCERRNRPATVRYYKSRLDTHFRFGKRNLSDLSRQDFQNKIRGCQTSRGEQHHALVAARTLLNWAVREQYLDASPLAGMRGYKPPKARERTLSEAELKEVFTKARTAPYPFGDIVAILAVTGMRRSEVSHLRWEWIDRSAQTITLPADLTKNGRSHIVPFGRWASEVLEQVPEMSDYLFPARSGKGPVFNGWGKSFERFCATLDNVEPFTLHDLRRTFATIHAKIGTPIHVTERLLNHVSGTISGVAAIYNRHDYLSEMRLAQGNFDEFLAKLLDD